MKKLLIGLLFAALGLPGCAPGTGPKQQGGALLGAGTGALISSAFGHGHGRLAAVAVGTLAGAMIGQEIGRELDQNDRVVMHRHAQQSLETLPTNQVGSWHNPDTGHSGTLTPTRTYQVASGGYCREYQQTVTVGGHEELAYGTACREADGSWKIIN